MPDEERGMLSTAINSSSGYLSRPNLKRAKNTNIHTFGQTELDNAMRYLSNQQITGQKKFTYQSLQKKIRHNK